MNNHKMKIEIPKGVESLLATSNTPMPPDDFYTFEGDLCQMLVAAKVAENLGIKTGIASGLPYVLQKDEYDKVVQYIVDNEIEGYWHYQK